MGAKHNTGPSNGTYEYKGSSMSTSIPKEWDKYIDESKDEFWKEGNYLPDQGFVILLKDPTLENAKLWLLRMEKKAKRAEEVMALVLKAQKELVKEGIMKDRYDMVLSKNKEFQPLQKLYQDNLKTLTYFFLFKPGCHACSKTAKILEDFPNVVPLQVTKDKLHHWSSLPKTNHASDATKDDYLKNGVVPVVVVADPTVGRVTKLEGLQSKKQLLEASIKLMELRKGRG